MNSVNPCRESLLCVWSMVHVNVKQIAVPDRYLMSETSFIRVKFVLSLANSASDYKLC